MHAQQPDEATTTLRLILNRALRIQYFELDALCRGITVFHRQGNIVGNGKQSASTGE